ncbi:RNA recognition motif domain-containing protein [Ditylenchus destructor]|uniref:RNA recognition motif domain-containing protein n=1 Tax=Ditylenchus destructor TaxID=166010 RepID=A0AAD4QTW8_9BILA|nr:RNA recognition motif domain-containing protein [Ditylenchus destructor]
MLSNSDSLDAKVYVGGLPEDATSREFYDEFHRFGRIRKVWVARRPPGFPFIEFEDARDAEDAVKGMDGNRICGVRARVERSKNPRLYHHGILIKQDEQEEYSEITEKFMSPLLNSPVQMSENIDLAKTRYVTHCLRKSKNSNQPTVPHTANGPISQYAGKSLNLAGTSGNSLFTGFGDPDKPEKGDAKDAMKPEKDMNEIIEWAKILLKFKMKRSDVKNN